MRRVVLAALLAVAGASNDYATPESHPHLEDMVSRVFAVDGATAANEAAMDDYFSSRSGPRAGIVFLLKDLRFNGKPYKQNAKWGACTYIDQAIRSVGSLLQKGSLLAKYPKRGRGAGSGRAARPGTNPSRRYPILLYHADWTSDDRAILERAAGLNGRGTRAGPAVKAWWQRVVFGPSALPPYLYDVNRTVAGWRELHVQGDLNQATKANIHGFGYMLMCRFYAGAEARRPRRFFLDFPTARLGLIHHAPLTRKLDFYLRIDGDSRLSAVQLDPFEHMATRGFKYANYGGNYKEIIGGPAALPAKIAALHPGETFATRAWSGRDACPGQGVACPLTQKGGGPGPKGKPAAGGCSMHCPLHVPDDPSQIKLPVPLCKGKAGGAPRCPAFYNNFEIVDMRAFRTPLQWEFFLLAERSHAFLCEAFPQRSRAGKCGGGGMGDAIFRTLQVNTFIAPKDVAPMRPHVSYHHPAPIAKFCGPGGTTDGGPPVQRIQ